MKKLTLFLILGMLTLNIPLQAQKSLDSYLIEAGQKNPELVSLFKSYLSVLEKIPQVGNLPDPQLAMAYFLFPVETRMGPQRFKLSVNQFFPWFGILDAAEERVAIEAKARLEVFEEAKSRLFHEIRLAYFNLYFTSKAIRVSNDNLEFLSSLKRMVLIRIESGEASSLDEIRLEIESGDLINEIADLDESIQTQWIRFDNLINSPDFGRPQIPDSFDNLELSWSQSDIWSKLLEKNHLLLKTDFELSALQVQKELAELEGMPDFNIGLDYIAVGKGSNNLSGKDALILPKIGISIPIYRDKYKAKIKEVSFLTQAKEAHKENQINLLENSLVNILAEYRDANRRIDLFQEQERLAFQALEILESSLSTGDSPFEEVLRMERKRLGYSLSLAKAYRDKGIAISYVNYLMGL